MQRPLSRHSLLEGTVFQTGRFEAPPRGAHEAIKFAPQQAALRAFPYLAP